MPVLLLCQVTNISLLWQARSAVADPGAVPAYLQRRNPFVSVLQALLDSGDSEPLQSPRQLLRAAGVLGLFGQSSQQTSDDELLSTELEAQLAACIPTLQVLLAPLNMQAYVTAAAAVVLLLLTVLFQLRLAEISWLKAMTRHCCGLLCAYLGH